MATISSHNYFLTQEYPVKTSATMSKKFIIFALAVFGFLVVASICTVIIGSYVLKASKEYEGISA